MDRYERQKRYLQQQDEIKVRMPIGNKQDIQNYCLSHGWKSANQFITNLIDYAIANGLDAQAIQNGIRQKEQD